MGVERSLTDSTGIESVSYSRDDAPDNHVGDSACSRLESTAHAEDDASQHDTPSPSDPLPT